MYPASGGVRADPFVSNRDNGASRAHPASAITPSLGTSEQFEFVGCGRSCRIGGRNGRNGLCAGACLRLGGPPRTKRNEKRSAAQPHGAGGEGGAEALDEGRRGR